MKLIKCKICGKEHQGRVCSSFARSTARRRESEAKGPKAKGYGFVVSEPPARISHGEALAGTQALPVDTNMPVAKNVVNNTHGTKPLSTMGANPTTDRPVVAGSHTEMPLSGLRSLSKDIEEPALRKGHEVSRGAERKEQHPTPKPKFNKTAYMKAYMADLRAANKIGMTIREYRERKRDDNDRA